MHSIFLSHDTVVEFSETFSYFQQTGMFRGTSLTTSFQSSLFCVAGQINGELTCSVGTLPTEYDGYPLSDEYIEIVVQILEVFLRAFSSVFNAEAGEGCLGKVLGETPTSAAELVWLLSLQSDGIGREPVLRVQS